MRSTDGLVLVVDDDDIVRRVVRAGLEHAGFSVVDAASLGTARALLTEPIAGLVLDRQLDDGDGLELVDDVAERHPRAVVVLHSASGFTTPPGFRSAPKGNVASIIAALRSTAPPADDL